MGLVRIYFLVVIITKKSYINARDIPDELIPVMGDLEALINQKRTGNPIANRFKYYFFHTQNTFL